MTDLWLPIEEQTNIHDRAFRIEIENSEDPVLNLHIERMFDVGGELVSKRMPSISLAMSAMLADAELAPLVVQIVPALTEVSRILWARSIAQKIEEIPLEI